MDFNEYQAKARETAVYPIDTRIFYPALGLSGEVGEVCNLIKKIYRDDNGVITDERRTKLKDEISDTFWYLASLCSDLGFNMSDIAQYNIEKLQSRKQKGTLKGSGER